MGRSGMMEVSFIDSLRSCRPHICFRECFLLFTVPVKFIDLLRRTPSLLLLSSSLSSSLMPATSATELNHLRNQMANILYVPSSTFTTCACEFRTPDCALTRMAAFADRQEHFLHLLRHSQDHVSEDQPYTTNRRMRKGRDIDLGLI